MKGETPDQALMRAAVVAGYRAAEDAARVADRMVIDRIISRDEDGNPRSDEAGCTQSPAHDLLPNSCVKLANEWVVFKRLDDRGHLVVAKPGSYIEWTYEPTAGETFLSAEPF